MARFDSLQFHVHRLKPDESVEKAFPVLFKKPEFKALMKRADYNRLTAYIVYLYDKNTDLTEEFKSNLQARKDAAAQHAGYERTKDGKWPAHIKKVMDITDKEATAAIMAFLKHQKYHIWTEIVVTEQELDEFQRIRFTGLGKKKGDRESDIIDAANRKDKLKLSCETRIKSLESLYNQFYEDHQEVRKAEFEEMMTPENAERLFEKEPPPFVEIKPEV